eukprot:TRINITY_DN3617_c0_g1_i2.p1 TRINITY_DN3617_c0_g1~~TRINITY_DN3617_c0_g1_i2.p1  ORF type:complete len:864 (-),score=250.69 TRINITY_DN3617_c0_g1_i2:13-2415(-)
MRDFILVEMVARTIKSHIAALHREEMKRQAFPAEQPYIKIIVEFLNYVFFKEVNETFWSKDVKVMLRKKFLDTGLTEEEAQGTITLDQAAMSKLFERVQDILGLEFSGFAKERFNGESLMLSSDIVTLTTKVKKFNWIDFADGMSLLMDARKRPEKEASRLLKTAQIKLLASANAFSSHYESRIQLGRCYALSAKIDQSNENNANAIEAFEEVLRLNPKFYPAYVDWGRVLLRKAKASIERRSPNEATTALDTATEIIGKALEIESKSPEALNTLAYICYLKGRLIVTDDTKEIPEPLTKAFELIKEALALPANRKAFKLAARISYEIYRLKYLWGENTAAFRQETVSYFLQAVEQNSAFSAKFIKKIPSKQILTVLSIALEIPDLLKSMLDNSTELILRDATVQKSDLELMPLLMPHLLTLDVSGATGFTPETAASLIPACLKLEKFIAENFKELTDDVFLELIENASTDLVLINVADNEQLTDKSISKAISDLINLTSLDIRNTKFTEAALLTPSASLETLVLCNEELVLTESALTALPSYQSLTKIDLRRCKLIPEETILTIIKTCTNLKYIDLLGIGDIPPVNFCDAHKLNDHIREVRLPSGPVVHFTGGERMGLRGSRVGNNLMFSGTDKDVSVVCRLMKTPMGMNNNVIMDLRSSSNHFSEDSKVSSFVQLFEITISKNSPMNATVIIKWRGGAEITRFSMMINATSPTQMVPEIRFRDEKYKGTLMNIFKTGTFSASFERSFPEGAPFTKAYNSTTSNFANNFFADIPPGSNVNSAFVVLVMAAVVEARMSNI